MEFTPSKRQEDILRKTRKFVEAHVQPNADRWDKTKKFPLDAWRTLAKLGLAGLLVPRKYGGGGQDVVSYILAVEEILKVRKRSRRGWLESKIQSTVSTSIFRSACSDVEP